jgi:5-oxoprolinase (ATP-hydrolysing)/N-methylhydantoinase A
VIDAAGRLLHDCGTGELVTLASAGEVVELVLAGGAGHGPASERDPAAQARDVALGLASQAPAAAPAQAAEFAK